MNKDAAERVSQRSRDEPHVEEQKAKRKILAAQRRRERRQRVRQRIRERREIEALQEQLRKKAADKPKARISPRKAAKLREHAEAQQQKEAQDRMRNRRRMRINNTIAMLIDAVRATRNDAVTVGPFPGELLAGLRNRVGIDGGRVGGGAEVAGENARIKEITRKLNDRAYMCAQRMRCHRTQGSQAGTDGEAEGAQEVYGDEDGGIAAQSLPEDATKLSDGDVIITFSDEGEQGAAPDKSGNIVSAKLASVHGHDAGDDESSLFSTDDEVEDFLDGTFHQDDIEDGSDDEEELAADIDECLDAYLANAVCKSDKDRSRLQDAKKLMRGWIEINERSRSAEIKNLRRNGPEMSAMDREYAKESIKCYDSFVYGGVGGGLMRMKSLDFILRGAAPTTSKGGARGYSQTSPPWRRMPQDSSQAKPATGTPGQAAESLAELLRGFRFYDVNNREHAFGTSFPGTASHPFLSSRTARTRTCIQSMYQPEKPDQTLVDPNLWAKFYGTDSWATCNNDGGNKWQNDCDYAQVNMKRWAERFCDGRDKRSCSFDGSCKENLEEQDDGGFFSREEEMPDAPPLNEGETFGTKGFKKPAWEFSRMPAPITGTSVKSSIRNPFAPASSNVLNEVKKKGVTWQEDLIGGNSDGGLFTPKEIPQEQPQLYQPPQGTAWPQTFQSLQMKSQSSPKPSLKSPSGTSSWSEPSRIPMDTSFLDDDMNKPDPPPVPFDGKPFGYVDLDPNRIYTRSQTHLDDAYIEKMFGSGGELMAGLQDAWDRSGGGPTDGSLVRDHPEAWEDLNMSTPQNMTSREFEQHVAKLEKAIAQKDAQAQAAGSSSSSTAAAAAANAKRTTSTSVATSSPVTRQPPAGYPRPSVPSHGGNNSKRVATTTPAVAATTATASPVMRQPPPGYSRSSNPSQAGNNNNERKHNPTSPATTSAPPQPGSATKRRFQPFNPAPEMNIAFYERHRPGGSAWDEAERMKYEAFLGFGNKNNTPAKTQNFNQSSSAAAATATSQRFAKGPIPGIPPPAKPSPQQQQSQHQDAARTATHGFSDPSSSPAVGTTGGRPAKRTNNNAFTNPIPYRNNNNNNFNLRGGGGAGSSESDTSSSNGGRSAPLYKDEAAVAGMSLSSEVAIEKARHAIRHAGPKAINEARKDLASEVMKDTDQSSSGQYVDT